MDSSAIVEKTRIKVANKSEKVHQMHIRPYLQQSRTIVDEKAGVFFFTLPFFEKAGVFFLPFLFF